MAALNLRGKNIGCCEAMKIARDLGDKTTVDLRDNDIGAGGAIAIANALQTNSTITTVALSRNDIGPEGAEAILRSLEHNPTITGVYLDGNDLGLKGAEAAGHMLQYNNTITTLSLENNDIGDEGAAAILRALEHNFSITALYLRGNGISVEEREAIEFLVERNRKIAQATPIFHSRIAVRRGQENPSTLAGRMANLPRHLFNSILSTSFGVYPKDTKNDRRLIVKEVAAGAGED